VSFVCEVRVIWFPWDGEANGAVTGIIVRGAAASYMTATCGANGTVRVLDARVSLGEAECLDLPKVRYSFKAEGGPPPGGRRVGTCH
jgi:hypothetical protein